MQPQTYTEKNSSWKRNINSHNLLVHTIFIHYQGATASSLLRTVIIEFHTDNTNFVTHFENK